MADIKDKSKPALKQRPPLPPANEMFARKQAEGNYLIYHRDPRTGRDRLIGLYVQTDEEADHG